MTLGDAAVEGINEKYRVFARKKKNATRRPRADAVNGQKLFAERAGRRSKHSRKGAAVVVKQKIDEGFQFFRCLAKIARRTNERSELCDRNCANRGRSQEPRAAQIGDCGFDIRPGSVLRENCADDNFESRTPRPPMLRAVSFKQREKILVQRGEYVTGRDIPNARDTFRHVDFRVDRFWQSSG